jgi:hypothetical protein
MLFYAHTQDWTYAGITSSLLPISFDGAAVSYFGFLSTSANTRYSGTNYLLSSLSQVCAC